MYLTGLPHMERRKAVSDNLVERLRNWEKVYDED